MILLDVWQLVSFASEKLAQTEEEKLDVEIAKYWWTLYSNNILVLHRTKEELAIASLIHVKFLINIL